MPVCICGEEVKLEISEFGAEGITNHPIKVGICQKCERRISVEINNKSYAETNWSKWKRIKDRLFWKIHARNYLKLAHLFNPHKKIFSQLKKIIKNEVIY